MLTVLATAGVLHGQDAGGHQTPALPSVFGVPPTCFVSLLHNPDAPFSLF